MTTVQVARLGFVALVTMLAVLTASCTGKSSSAEPQASLVSPAPSGRLVPDLVGLRDQEALRILDDLGLRSLPVLRGMPWAKLWHVVDSDPAPGSAVPPGSVVRLIIPTNIRGLPRGADDALTCPNNDRVAFGGPRTRLLPGGEAYVRTNIPGIRGDDDVVQVTRTVSDGKGLWHVIRRGEVLAVLAFPSLDGEVCIGSGIAGA